MFLSWERGTSGTSGKEKLLWPCGLMIFYFSLERSVVSHLWALYSLEIHKSATFDIVRIQVLRRGICRRGFVSALPIICPKCHGMNVLQVTKPKKTKYGRKWISSFSSIAGDALLSKQRLY